MHRNSSTPKPAETHRKPATAAHHRRIGITTNFARSTSALDRIRQLLLPSVRPISTFGAVDGRQRVEQVIHVEADLHLVAVVVDLELSPRPLPAPGCAPGSSAYSRFSAKRMPRYFSFDRIAARCSAWRSILAICADHQLRGLARNHAAIFRESAVNQLRSEANVADLDANVIAADRYSQRRLPPPRIRCSSSTPLRGTITCWPRLAAASAGPPRTTPDDGRQSRPHRSTFADVSSNRPFR